MILRKATFSFDTSCPSPPLCVLPFDKVSESSQELLSALFLDLCKCGC